MNDWITNIVWLLAVLFLCYLIFVTTFHRRVQASCRCGKVQINGRVSSADVSGLVEQLERSCPACNFIYHGGPVSNDSWRPTAPRSSTECSS